MDNITIIYYVDSTEMVEPKEIKLDRLLHRTIGLAIQTRDKLVITDHEAYIVTDISYNLNNQGLPAKEIYLEEIS